MKKLICALLALAMLFSVCACAAKSGNPLVGSWSYTESTDDGDATVTFTFTEDGKLSYKMSVELSEEYAKYGLDPEDFAETEEGTYTVKGDKLITEMNGTTTEATFSVKDGKLTITDGDETMVFTKADGKTGASKDDKPAKKDDKPEEEVPEKDPVFPVAPAEPETPAEEPAKPAEEPAAPAEEPAAPVSTDVEDNLAALYAFYHDGIITKLTDAISGVVDTHNAKIEAADPDNYYFNEDYLSLMYMPFTTLDDVYGTMFNGNISEETAVTSLGWFGYENISVSIENGKVTISYEDTGWDEKHYTAEVIFRYDASSLTYAYEYSKNGKLESWLECVCVDKDVYAIQSMANRAVVRMDGGNVAEVWHAAYVYSSDWETGELSEDTFINDYPSCSILGKTGLGESWVREFDTDNHVDRLYHLTGTRLEITGLKSELDENWNTVRVPGFEFVIDD